MVGRVWDDRQVTLELLEHVREEVATLQRDGRPPPTLAEITVGQEPPGRWLHMCQSEACRLTGIPYRTHTFPAPCDPQYILQTLAALNADPAVAGISIGMHPAPELRALAAAIAPEKDVDGVHPLHLGRCLTNKRSWHQPRAADLVQLLKRLGLSFVGIHVICIGNTSGLAGRLAWLCLHENATVSASKAATTWPVAQLLRRGDVLVIDSDTLPPIDSTALKSGVVVIDARSHPDGWMVHRSEALPTAVTMLIPAPGGIGPTAPAARLRALLTMSRALEVPSIDV